MLTFEKKTVVFYHFYFQGIDKPMIIEAMDKISAMQYVAEEVSRRHIPVTLENLKLTTPIFGVTKKEENHTELIWAGFDYSPTGWLDRDSFFRIKNVRDYL